MFEPSAHVKGAREGLLRFKTSSSISTSDAVKSRESTTLYPSCAAVGDRRHLRFERMGLLTSFDEEAVGVPVTGKSARPNPPRRYIISDVASDLRVLEHHLGAKPR